MVNRVDNIRRIYAGALLLAFISFYANTTLFNHRHIVNGATIVHSHIHNSGHHSSPTGGHTSTQITLIAQLAQFESQQANTPDHSSVDILPMKELIFGESTTKQGVTSIQSPSLRAPPAIA